ncbi:MAG: hypothetical protein ACRC8P_03065, partial [Spiroplasma sp.]
SFNFLTGVLKLEAKGDGAWDTKTFEKAKADAISLTVVSIDPTLKAIGNDYAVSKGIVKVQWKEKNNVGSQYSINLKADETTGTIKRSLPESGDLTLKDFDITKGVLAKFAIGQDKNSLPVGSDITSNLKVTAVKGKEVTDIAKKISQALTVTVTKVTATGDKFAVGDTLTVKITLGSVQFSTEYQLILKDNSLMDDKILFDLGLYDSDGKSQVEVALAIKDGKVSWSADKLNNLTAAKLLTDENKAKSEESFNFLTDVLKLEAKGDGVWDTKTFEKAKADAISLTVVSINPTLKAIGNDYAVSKGIGKVQWKEKNNVGSQYSINLKADETTGTIKQHLPSLSNLNWSNFDKDNGPLAHFFINSPKSMLPVDSDITRNFIIEAGKGKEVADIAKKINQELKLTISSFEIKSEGETFKAGDILKFKITLGSVQFSTEYQLILE